MTDHVGVEAEIEHLKHELGCTLDRELAMNLGIDASAVAAWRRRGKVPEKYRLRAERRRDEVIGLTGAALPSHNDLRDAYIFALLAVFSERLNSGMFTLASEEYNEIWRGFRLRDAHSYFERSMLRTADRDRLRRQFEALRGEVEAGDIVWLERLGKA